MGRMAHPKDSQPKTFGNFVEKRLPLDVEARQGAWL
jgi:hypothetical protein